MKMNASDEEIEKNKSSHKCSVNCNCSASQKRPMNAFLIFCKRHRSVVKQKYPHLENRSITKILGEWWAKIDIEQKQKYTELARQYKEAFMKANPHFKWYKTDIKLQSNMQPCSPPSFVSTFSNSNSSLNCNLYNNINYQNESDNSQPQKTIKLNSKNPNELISQTCSNTDKCNNNSNTLTPKPPKKRYLENGEFKELGAQSNSNNNSTKNEDKQNKMSENSSTSGIKNYAIGGPPVLDIETMDRVIENAFRANDNSEDKKSSKSHKNNSSQFKLFLSNNVKQSKSTDCLKNETLDSRGEKPNDLRCTEKFNELIEGSDNSLYKNFITKQNKRSRSNSPTNNGIEKLFVNNSSPSCNLDKDKTNLDQNKNDKDEDKPLNLSSTTTLKASQQVLIDNLIDKLLSNGAEGKPMPIEMLQNSSSNSFASNNSNLSLKNQQQRKERSCKGKRYLEMLNENKLSKRTKNQTTNGNGNSSSSIGNNSINEENGNKTVNSQSSNASSGSKWVSGGFDLEEHIAALPQLGDNHLSSVLDSTKANLIISSHQRSNNNSTMFSNTGKNDKDNSNNLINDQKQDFTEAKKNSSFNYSQVNNNSLVEKNQHSSSPHENLSDNRVNDSQLSNSSTDLAEKIVERLNINSQALECDGLVALAEVALQQAHRISSPSCT